jgi:hypothetical protein
MVTVNPPDAHCTTDVAYHGRWEAVLDAAMQWDVGDGGR